MHSLLHYKNKVILFLRICSASPGICLVDILSLSFQMHSGFVCKMCESWAELLIAETLRGLKWISNPFLYHIAFPYRQLWFTLQLEGWLVLLFPSNNSSLKNVAEQDVLQPHLSSLTREHLNTKAVVSSVWKSEVSERINVLKFSDVLNCWKYNPRFGTKVVVCLGFELAGFVSYVNAIILISV